MKQPPSNQLLVQERANSQPTKQLIKMQPTGNQAVNIATINKHANTKPTKYASKKQPPANQLTTHLEQTN